MKVITSQYFILIKNVGQMNSQDNDGLKVLIMSCEIEGEISCRSSCLPQGVLVYHRKYRLMGYTDRTIKPHDLERDKV